MSQARHGVGIQHVNGGRRVSHLAHALRSNSQRMYTVRLRFVCFCLASLTVLVLCTALLEGAAHVSHPVGAHLDGAEARVSHEYVHAQTHAERRACVRFARLCALLRTVLVGSFSQLTVPAIVDS